MERRIVLVTGSGPSGTLSGALQALGLFVPDPAWVAVLHDDLLRRCNVDAADARPSAWLEAGRLATAEAPRERLHTWLEEQFADGGPELVVEDPRLAWFLGLWRWAALRCDATPAEVTVLRPVTDVEGGRSGDVQRTAAWLNLMLHTERSTRGSGRRFVRYADLLDDWTIPVATLGEAFDLEIVRSANAQYQRKVHEVVEPAADRVELAWADLAVPARLREIAEESSRQLDRLAGPDGDTPDVHDALDRLRAAYADLYGEAEELAASSVAAARRERPKRAGQGKKQGPDEEPPPERPQRRWGRKG